MVQQCCDQFLALTVVLAPNPFGDSHFEMRHRGIRLIADHLEIPLIVGVLPGSSTTRPALTAHLCPFHFGSRHRPYFPGLGNPVQSHVSRDQPCARRAVLVILPDQSSKFVQGRVCLAALE
jgi:hypothetical protein